MKIFLVCMVFMWGIVVGAALMALGENIAVDAITECIKLPGSCGIEEDDLDPPERLIPA
jgi:hypothetical protein